MTDANLLKCRDIISKIFKIMQIQIMPGIDAQPGLLRYFGGLAIEQIADLLDIAPSTVKRDWALARIWLARELRPAATHPDKK